MQEIIQKRKKMGRFFKRWFGSKGRFMNRHKYAREGTYDKYQNDPSYKSILREIIRQAPKEDMIIKSTQRKQAREKRKKKIRKYRPKDS